MAGPIPEMRPFDLGQTLMTAEALKGMKRQAETDKIRDAYLGVQMDNARQSGVIAQDENRRAQQGHDAEIDAFKAKYKFLLAENAAKDPDPAGYIKRFAPELIQDFDQHYGQGSFERLPPEQLAQVLGQIRSHAAAQAGIQPQQEEKGFTLSAGETRFGPDGKPIASVAPKAEKTPAQFRAMNAQEIASAGLPPGTAAQVNDGTGQIQVLSKRDASATLSQKDATSAKQKLMTVKLARQQLNEIRKRFQGIQGGMSAGPLGQGYLPTEGGRSFDAAVDQMRSTLTALTRTPGVGAMSDYETRLDQAKFPSRQNYESVTQQQIDAIDNQLNLIERGYSHLLGGTQPTEETQEPDLSSLSDEEILRQLSGG
jgi:hypothetical protein